MKTLIINGMALIAATYGLARFGYGLFLPRFSDAFDMSPALAGAIQAGSFLSYCAAALVAAGFSSRPRLLIRAAGAAAALGAAGVAAAPSSIVLAAGVVIAGAGAGFATPGLVTLIERHVRPGRQENAQTIVNAGTGVGIVGAGVLMLLTAAQWRLGWTAIAAAAVLATAAVLRSAGRSWAARPEGAAGTNRGARPSGAPRDSGQPTPELRPEIRGEGLGSLLRALAWPLAAAALAGVSSAAVWTFGRSIMAAGAGEEIYSIGAWMVLGAFGVLGAAAGRIVQVWSLRTAWTLTTLAMAGATILLGAAPGYPAAAYAAAAVFGASYTALSGVLILCAARMVPGRASTGTVALFISLAVGQAAGSVALGMLLRPEAPALAFTVAGMTGIAAVLPAAGFRRNEATDRRSALVHPKR